MEQLPPYSAPGILIRRPLVRPEQTPEQCERLTGMRANFAGAETLDRQPALTEATQAQTGRSETQSTQPGQPLPEAGAVAPRGNLAEVELGRSADPLRRYLQEIAAADLLSRDGEVALAQRIEAGQAAVLGALHRSPLLRKAIADWSKDLRAKTIVLREIIDLAATQTRLQAGSRVVAQAPAATASLDEESA